MAKMASIQHEIMMLSGESTVPAELLFENETLVEMILKNVPYQELLDYVNENW